MKEGIKVKNNLKKRRVIRTRSKVFGTAEKPRLAVFRSLKHISVQAINDQMGQTVAEAYDREVKAPTFQAKALAVGQLVAKKLLDKKITLVVFDKRHYKYHGLVKQVADGAREGGLKF